MAAGAGAGKPAARRNALALPLAGPCKLVASAIFFLLLTLFALENMYAWCDASAGVAAAEQAQQLAASQGPVKAILCSTSVQYRRPRILENVRSALASCVRERRDGEAEVELEEMWHSLSDEVPNRRSWKSQWAHWNLSWPSPAREDLEDDLAPSGLTVVDTRKVPVMESCSTHRGPVVVGLQAKFGTVPCPVLWRCQKQGQDLGMKKLEAMCWNPKFMDVVEPASLPTEDAFITPRFGEKTVTNYQQYIGAVVFLANVYTNVHAQVFDSRHIFLKGGCWEQRQLVPLSRQGENRGKVIRVPLGINLCSFYASSQFHGLVELMARIAILFPMIEALPSAPLLLARRDFPFVSTFFRLLGEPRGLDGRPVQMLEEDNLVHADMLLVALSPSCGKSSRSVWRHIRDHRFRVPRSAWAGPGSWYLVLEERKGTRGIVQHDELLARLQAEIGSKHVRLFSDREEWSMEATRELFSGAAIVVGPHGAGLSNIVFMPHGGSLVEVRPSNFSNHCYHVLADALRFNYYRFDSPGVKSSLLDVDVEEIVSLVAAIVRARGLPVPFYPELSSTRRRL